MKKSIVQCIILGGGGHAKVIIDCIREMGIAHPYGIVDVNAAMWGKEILGVPVLGGDELLPQLRERDIDYFAVGLGSVGDNSPRKRLFDLARLYNFKPLTVIHPAAICSKKADIGHGCQLLPGSIVNAGARLGVNVIINSGAIVEHDCEIGNHVHVATGAKLSGVVIVEEGSHIGVGATVKQCVRIGRNSVVGAGAVVIDDVKPNCIVVGSPARPLRG